MNASSPEIPSLPVSQASMGTVVACVYVSLILFGVLVHQVYEYLRTYKTDRPFLKGLVLASLAIATSLGVIHMHIVYHYLVTNYFNPLALLDASWSLQAMSLFTGIQISLSQTFFVRRTWIMGRKYKPLVAVAALCSVTQLAISIACTVDIARGGTVENALEKAASVFSPSSLRVEAESLRLQWFASAINALAVAADVLLTGILIISLHQQRTGITTTDSLITVLMLYAINTGLLQGLVNSVVLVFALIAPHDLVYMGLGMVASRLYPITLLAALNARKGLNHQMQKTVVFTGPDVYALRPVTMDASATYKEQHDSAQLRASSASPADDKDSPLAV
ncbi:hypothetical protein BV20DRAFT_1052331 [Pilatotrama ljubarskyi]|nr:hypothetical protein BV20DRAFT_1052331 [Pilatotrama ljubarskyi]